jgi:hypothetical protein
VWLVERAGRPALRPQGSAGQGLSRTGSQNVSLATCEAAVRTPAFEGVLAFQ